MPVINYICSFGRCCHTSTFLYRNQLRSASYPFDWIYASVSTIIHCIEDGFSTFLDQSYYIDCEKKHHDVECGHSFYDKNMFRHKDPRCENDHQYYQRCVSRFNNLLACTGPKMFVIILENMENQDNYDTVKTDIIDFNNRFSKYTTDYTLLVVYNIPLREHYHASEYVDNIHFLELHTWSKSNGVIFEMEADNLLLQNTIKDVYLFELLPTP